MAAPIGPPRITVHLDDTGMSLLAPVPRACCSYACPGMAGAGRVTAACGAACIDMVMTCGEITIGPAIT